MLTGSIGRSAGSDTADIDLGKQEREREWGERERERERQTDRQTDRQRVGRERRGG